MTVLGLAIAILAVGIDNYIFAATLPAIARDLGESIASVGLLVSAYALPTAIFAPAFGPLSDRRGRRFALMVGLAIFCIAATGCILAPSLPFLLVARAVNGIGSAIVVPAVFAAAGDIPAPSLRARTMSLMATMLPLSTLLGLPVGALVAAATSWRGAFAFILVVAVAALVLVLRLPHVSQLVTTRPPGYREALRTVLRDRRAVRILATTTLWFTGSTGLFTYLAEFVHVRFAVPVEQAGFIYVVVGLVGVVAARVSGRTIERLGARTVVLTGMALFIGSVSLLGSAPNLPTAIMLFAIWAAGTWFAVPGQSIIVAGLSDRTRGTMLAFNSSAINLGFVFGPIVTGRVIEEYGFQVGAPWAAFLGALAFAAAWRVLPGRADTDARHAIEARARPRLSSEDARD
jgi:predicted MFS family arabinose efflux permease